MRSTCKFLLTLLIGAAGALPVATSAAGAGAADDTPPRQLGGLDLGAYCRSLGSAGATLGGPTAYDWHCADAAGARSDLTFEAACRWTYATPSAVDRIGDFRDPASVTCWRVAPQFRAPDFTDYCTATGHSAAALLGTTAYGWRCVSYRRSGPVYYDVDVQDACRHATGGAATVERFNDYYDPGTWQCRL